MLYRVKKYLYGLPDAGQQFHLGFTKVLADRGYTMSKCDPCLFYRMVDDEKTFIYIHVDDCYIFYNKIKYIDKLKEKVEEVYPVNLEYNATGFLGERLSSSSIVCMSGSLPRKPKCHIHSYKSEIARQGSMRRVLIKCSELAWKLVEDAMFLDGSCDMPSNCSCN
jgi:hypothetical protein